MKRELYVLAEDPDWGRRFAERVSQKEEADCRCLGFCSGEEMVRRLRSRLPPEETGDEEIPAAELPQVLIGRQQWDRMPEEQKEFLLRSGIKLALLTEETKANASVLREIYLYQSAEKILRECSMDEKYGYQAENRNPCRLIVLYSPGSSALLGRAGWLTARILSESGCTLLADLEDFPFEEESRESRSDSAGDKEHQGGSGSHVTDRVPGRCLSDLLYLRGDVHREGSTPDLIQHREEALSGLTDGRVHTDRSATAGVKNPDEDRLSLSEYADHCGKLDILRPCSEPEDIWGLDGESIAKIFRDAAKEGSYDSIIVTCGAGRNPFPLLREADWILLIEENTSDQKNRTSQFLNLLRRRGEARISALCERWTLPSEEDGVPMDRAEIYGRTGAAIREYLEGRHPKPSLMGRENPDSRIPIRTSAASSPR